MADTNFTDVLDTPSSDIERPKPLPAGQYICACIGLPLQDKSSKKGTPYVKFTAKVLQALDDVDQEALAEMGGLSDKVVSTTFYLTENSVFRLKDFLFDDLKLEDDGGPLRPKLEATAGCQFIATIKHQASEDGKAIYANVASTAPAEG